METAHRYTVDELKAMLSALDTGSYGAVLRAKGIVPLTDGTFAHFDYVPEEADVRVGTPEITGKLCVIGSDLKEADLATLFRI